MDITKKIDADLMRFYQETTIWPVGKAMPIGMTPPEEKMTRILFFTYWLHAQEMIKGLVETIKKLEEALVECVNTCNGMDDPEKTVKELVEALELTNKVIYEAINKRKADLPSILHKNKYALDQKGVKL